MMADPLARTAIAVTSLVCTSQCELSLSLPLSLRRSLSVSFRAAQGK